MARLKVINERIQVDKKSSTREFSLVKSLPLESSVKLKSSTGEFSYVLIAVFVKDGLSKIASSMTSSIPLCVCYSFQSTVLSQTGGCFIMHVCFLHTVSDLQKV